MLRALFQTVLGGSRPAKPRTTTPARFAPSLEALDAREVPAVLVPATDAPEMTTPAIVVVSTDTTDTNADTTSAKVKLQDFSFTAKLSKSSPMMF